MLFQYARTASRPTMLRALPLVVAIAVVAGPALADEQILGRWDSRSRTKGGIGNMFFFSADGAVDLTVGAMIDFEYEVRGNELHIRHENETVQTTRYSIVGNTLIRFQPDGARREAQRVGDGMPGMPAIVGRWRSRHKTGGDAIEEFTADGELRFRVPFVTLPGRYQIRGSQLLMQFPTEPPSYAGTYRIDGDILVIRWGQSPKEV